MRLGVAVALVFFIVVSMNFESAWCACSGTEYTYNFASGLLGWTSSLVATLKTASCHQNCNHECDPTPVPSSRNSISRQATPSSSCSAFKSKAKSGVLHRKGDATTSQWTFRTLSPSIPLPRNLATLKVSFDWAVNGTEFTDSCPGGRANLAWGLATSAQFGQQQILRSCKTNASYCGSVSGFAATSTASGFDNFPIVLRTLRHLVPR